MSTTPQQQRTVNGLQFDGYDTERHQGCVMYKGPFGTRYPICADCTGFNLKHSQRVEIRKGAYEGKQADVVGVHESHLWVHLVEENVAIALKGAANAQELDQLYSLQPVYLSAADGMTREVGPLGVEYLFEQRPLREIFGLNSEERICIHDTINVSVLGVAFGCLWVRRQGLASPLTGAINEQTAQALYLISEPIDTNSPKVTPRRAASTTPRRANKPPFTVVPAKQVAVCEAAFGNTFEADISRKALTQYGVNHGQVFTATKGVLRGKDITVVGVHLGSLWGLVEGDRRVSCLRNCETGDELREHYGFGSGGVKKEQPSPPKSEKAAATTPRKQSTTAAAETTPEAGEKKTPRPHKKLFHMWTSYGRQGFDTATNVTQPFGFHHGQSLKASKGPEKDLVFHVVGVLSGTLWVVQEGKPRAVALRHCFAKEDLQQRYAFTAIGKKDLTPLSFIEEEPPHTPLNTPRGGYYSSSVENTPRSIAVGGTSPRGTTTSYASAPAPSGSLPIPTLNFSALPSPPPAGPHLTSSSSLSPTPSPGRDRGTASNSSQRHYLKAVALLKTGAQSAAEDPLRFHRYYMTSTGQRLSHALGRLGRFRETYSSTGKNFDSATTDEMLSVMKQRAEIFA